MQFSPSNRVQILASSLVDRRTVSKVIPLGGNSRYALQPLEIKIPHMNECMLSVIVMMSHPLLTVTMYMSLDSIFPPCPTISRSLRFLSMVLYRMANACLQAMKPSKPRPCIPVPTPPVENLSH